MSSESFLEVRRLEVAVDVVVNATMAAIAKHGYIQHPEIKIYHRASSYVNPLLVSLSRTNSRGATGY
ncbi:hypothetical protein MTR67_038691 [Solanum verrucosum]|uniref:Uncharacterized protein n=1 Tax=Solanum verrucosum TaxID=315347 RepID=A0AAF0UGQ6_SOLVR|nr:hypothetical protein MTR67_038691 [Solanum verrucosum]